MDVARTREVLAALEREGVRYAVFGGVALTLHGLARATEDLDVFVAPTPENIDRPRAALFHVFADPHLDEITAEDLLGDYPRPAMPMPCESPGRRPTWHGGNHAPCLDTSPCAPPHAQLP